MSRWIMVINEYSGIQKRAVNMLSSVISGYLKYVLPVKHTEELGEAELKAHNLIVLGKACENTLLSECLQKGCIDAPEGEEGYSVFVGESIFNRDNQMIAIVGYDELGVLYGSMDFYNKYCGDILYKDKDIWGRAILDDPLGQKLNPWKHTTAPAIRHRAIWTWGHVIYDYRGFLDNMARLRLNELVIWNDRVPLNARDVVDYAHSLGIKVIFGFAWGWGVSCGDVLKNYDEKVLEALKENVIKTYEEQYACTGCDGIYFQSFTELNTDNVNGKCIAKLVTELVNDIAGALLEKYPELHIQFGLHATSVKNRLEHIAEVDKRIHIVWEDCGAFPYNYYPDKVSDFDETYLLTEALLKLRGDEERFGAVLKGMLKLDWGTFEHFSDSYVMGERTDSYIRERQQIKNKIWKIIQADWLVNAEYLRKTVCLIAEKGNASIVQALVEDAMLENSIMLPVALYAEMLWDPNEDTKKTIGQVSKYPCVNFANI